MKEHTAELITEMRIALRNRDKLFMRYYVLMDWRYVTVQKQLLLHYSSSEGDSAVHSKTSRVSHYENVYVTLEAAKEAHLNSPHSDRDPYDSQHVDGILRGGMAGRSSRFVV